MICPVCGSPDCDSTPHLRDGTAIREFDYRRGKLVERIVRTSDLPVTKDTPLYRREPV